MFALLIYRYQFTRFDARFRNIQNKTLFEIHCIYYSKVIMSAMESQITGVSMACSKACLGADQRIHQSSSSLDSVRGNNAEQFFNLMTSSCKMTSRECYRESNDKQLDSVFTKSFMLASQQPSICPFWIGNHQRLEEPCNAACNVENIMEICCAPWVNAPHGQCQTRNQLYSPVTVDGVSFRM